MSVCTTPIEGAAATTGTASDSVVCVYVCTCVGGGRLGTAQHCPASNSQHRQYSRYIVKLHHGHRNFSCSILSCSFRVMPRNDFVRMVLHNQHHLASNNEEGIEISSQLLLARGMTESGQQSLSSGAFPSVTGAQKITKSIEISLCANTSMLPDQLANLTHETNTS